MPQCLQSRWCLQQAALRGITQILKEVLQAKFLITSQTARPGFVPAFTSRPLALSPAITPATPAHAFISSSPLILYFFYFYFPHPKNPHSSTAQDHMRPQKGGIQGRMGRKILQQKNQNKTRKKNEGRKKPILRTTATMAKPLQYTL